MTLHVRRSARCTLLAATAAAFALASCANNSFTGTDKKNADVKKKDGLTDCTGLEEKACHQKKEQEQHDQSYRVVDCREATAKECKDKVQEDRVKDGGENSEIRVLNCKDDDKKTCEKIDDMPNVTVDGSDQGGKADSEGGEDDKNGGKDDGEGEGDLGTTADSGGSKAGKAELQEDEGEFACDRGQKGYVGKVYKLPEGTAALPNLDAMTPLGQIDALQLNVAPRDWESGFPGAGNLIEWFAVSFIAMLEIPEDGDYVFKTNSDDGSKLYIGRDIVLVNDGIHAPLEVEGKPIPLEKGKRRIKIEWYQGPRVQIALQVYWKRPGSSSFEIIPAQMLTHGHDCKLPDLGDLN